MDIIATEKKIVFLLVTVLLLGAYYAHENGAIFNSRTQFIFPKACPAIIRNESRDLSLKIVVPKPVCDNILQNLTNGVWVKSKNFISETHLKELDATLNKFRESLGMPAKLWRSDNKCGSKETMESNSKFASICDPDGLSCCTDFESGHCVESCSQQCKCSRCFDTAKLLFPSLAKWTVHDKRCLWRNYTALEACSLLNNVFSDGNVTKNFSNPHFHFFGDSLIHNMYLGLLVLLSGRKNTGTWNRCLDDDKIKKLCYGPSQFYYMQCLTTSSELHEVDDGLMCGAQGRHFNVTFKSYFAASFKNEMLQYVKALLDKPNNVITLGIGILERCKSDVVLNSYLKPVVELVKTSKTGWPKLLWVYPLRIGVVTAKKFWGNVGNDEVEIFIQDIDGYLKIQNIPVFNFRKLTTNVHSHDGTHYGLGLNVMKVQIWLNYLASQVLL